MFKCPWMLKGGERGLKRIHLYQRKRRKVRHQIIPARLQEGCPDGKPGTRLPTVTKKTKNTPKREKRSGEYAGCIDCRAKR